MTREEAFRAGQESMRKRVIAICEAHSERASMACVMTSGPDKESHMFAALSSADIASRVEKLEPELLQTAGAGIGRRLPGVE